MTDDRFIELLRAGLPRVVGDTPSRDLWRDIESRMDERPRWSPVDLGLTVAVGAVLLMNPEWLWLLAYYL